MCIEVKREYVTKRAITGWKTVRRTARDGVFVSRVNKAYRDKQAGCKTKGKVLTYKTGRTVSSPFKNTAGIYVYRRKRAAYNSDICCRIKVIVPAGTCVRVSPRGGLEGGGVLCAEKIKVVGPD